MLGVPLAVHVWFGTYSVLDVGKAGVPLPSSLCSMLKVRIG
jgi:hypothetical protein